MARVALWALAIAAAGVTGALAQDAKAPAATAQAAPSDNAAVASPALIAHRATYDLELKEASERSGIQAMFGRMVYEFTGSACKGYTTRFRFATKIDTGEDIRVSDQQLTSTEHAKEGLFEFENKSFTDEKVDKEVKGKATRVSEGLHVELEGDEPRKIDLPESLFPTEHMQKVVAAALARTPLFEARLFDGSEDGDKSLLVTSIIGKPSTSMDVADAGADVKVGESLVGKQWWPVTASYFAENENGDEEPTYRLSYKLYDNGVSRDLVMDYGDFSMSGTLKTLELLPEEKCEP